MWIIISIILAINSIWLLKLNKDLVERNNELIARNIMKSLTEREEEIPLKPLTSKQKELLKKNLDDNNSRPHKLMMDTENKVMVFRFTTSNISEDGLRQLSDNVKDLRGKGYYILVMDNTFDFSEINLCEKEVEQLKKVLKDKED